MVANRLPIAAGRPGVSGLLREMCTARRGDHVEAKALSNGLARDGHEALFRISVRP